MLSFGIVTIFCYEFRFSVDFGKNEVEVMKHVSIYLDPSESELLFDLLASSELKVIYQPYDWGLNC
jgi:hypothetical protein